MPHDMQEFADHIAELNRQIAERIWAIGCAPSRPARTRSDATSCRDRLLQQGVLPTGAARA